MKSEEILSWWFLVEPLPKESISHFLGRFRRENEITITMMGKITGLGSAVARWEKFRFIPALTQKDLKAMSEVVQVEVERLSKMFPPKGMGMKLEPIRLCAACYTESPCHKIDWQLKTTQFCFQHSLTLLAECPNCGARFKIPSQWVNGCCHRCFTAFGEMVKWQKNIVSKT